MNSGLTSRALESQTPLSHITTSSTTTTTTTTNSSSSPPPRPLTPQVQRLPLQRVSLSLTHGRWDEQRWGVPREGRDTRRRQPRQRASAGDTCSSSSCDCGNHLPSSSARSRRREVSELPSHLRSVREAKPPGAFLWAAFSGPEDQVRCSGS